MDMRMRHLKSFHNKPRPKGIQRFIDRYGDLFGKKHGICQQRIGKIKQIIDLNFRNDKGMSSCRRMNIEKRQVRLIFGNFVGWKLAFDYFCEDRCHNSSVFKWFSGSFIKRSEERRVGKEWRTQLRGG